MGLDIGTLTGRLELQDGMSTALMMMRGKVGSVESAFNDLNTSTKSLGLMIAATGVAIIGSVVGIGAAIMGMAEKGSKIVGVEDAFSRFGVSIEPLSSALKGTVHEMELMEMMNKSLGAGVKLSGADMTVLGETARAMGKAFGTDAAGALETLNMSLVTGNMRSLKRLGINIDVTAAEKKFAASIGTTRDQLSAAGILEAKRIAMLEGMKQRVDQMGVSEMSLAEKFKAAKVSVEEWFEKLYVAVAKSDSVNRAFDAIRDAVARAFGGNTQSMLDLVMRGVNWFSDKVRDAAPYIQAIRDWAVKLWHELVTVGEMAVNAANKLITAWKGVPDWMKGAALSIGGVAVASSLVADSFNAWATAAQGTAASMELLSKSGVVAMFTTLGAAIMVLVADISTFGLWVVVSETIAGWGAAATGFGATLIELATGPVGWTILAITALGTAIYLGIKYWDDIKKAVKPVTDVLSDLSVVVGGAIVDAWNGLRDTLSGVWDWVSRLVGGFKDLASGITGAVNAGHAGDTKWDLDRHSQRGAPLTEWLKRKADERRAINESLAAASGSGGAVAEYMSLQGFNASTEDNARNKAFATSAASKYRNTGNVDEGIVLGSTRLSFPPPETGKFTKDIGGDQIKSMNNLAKLYAFLEKQGLLTEDRMKSMASTAAGLTDAFASVSLPLPNLAKQLQATFDEKVMHKDAMKKAAEALEDQTLHGADLEIAQARRVLSTEIQAAADRAGISDKSFTEEETAAYAAFQVKVNLANKTSDTIEQRLRAQNVFTRDELDKTAQQFASDYDAMLTTGLYTTEQLSTAWNNSYKAQQAAGLIATDALLAQAASAKAAANDIGNLRLSGTALEVALAQQELNTKLTGFATEYAERGRFDVMGAALAQASATKRISVARVGGEQTRAQLQVVLDDARDKYKIMTEAAVGTYNGPQIEAARQAMVDANDRMLGIVTKDWRDSFSDIANMIADLFSGINSQIGQTAQLLGKLGNVLFNKDYGGKGISATTGQKTVAALAAASEMANQLITSQSVAAMGVKGALAGAATGAMIGSLGGPTAPVTVPVAAAIGAVIGAAAGAWNQISGNAKKLREANAKATTDIQSAYKEMVVGYGGVANLQALGNILGFEIPSQAEKGTAGLAHFNALLDVVKAKVDFFDAAMQQFGFTWKDLGDTMKAVSSANAAGNLTEQFNVLVGSGIGVDKVIKGMSGALSQYVIDAISTGQKIPVSMQPILNKMVELGQITDEAARKLLGLADSTLPTWADAKAAAERYGLTIDNLGKGLQQLGTNDAAQQFINDWKTLVTLGGEDPTKIATAMSSGVNEMLQRSMRFGLELPEQMRPIIAASIAAGTLVDAAGKAITDITTLDFAPDLTTATIDLTAAINNLIEAISGGTGFIDSSTLAPGKSPERPGVPTSNDTVPAAQGDLMAFSGGRGGGTAIIQINGRTLAEIVVPEIPGVVQSYGLGI